MKLEIKDLTKKYGRKIALKNVSISFDSGIYGILGANGAGKSTLLNIRVSSLSPTRGEVLFSGTDIRSKKSDYLTHLGYLPQNPSYYKNYTAEDFLKYMGVMKGMTKKAVKKRIPAVLEQVNLSSDAKNRLGTFSGGMIKRIGIAQAIINDPDVLILDEPTAGLDPLERIRLRKIISNVSKDKTVLLATHIVSDIEHIANRVIVMKAGEIIKNDTPDKLLEQMRGMVFSVETDQEGFDIAVSHMQVSNILFEDGKYHLRIIAVEKPFENSEAVYPDLEDIFFRYAQ